MESKKLEALLMAVDLGSFTKAAEVLGYTQSGLTHMMNSLEKEVGFTLLERGRSGVRLTEEGERIAPAVREFLQANARLDSVIEQYLTTVKPMHEAFVDPSKRNADIIVPNGGENTAAVEMLAHHIRNLIEKANMV